MSSAHSGGTIVKQAPKDALVMMALLKEMGVESHEPRVINQMIDLVYRYVANVVEEARNYSQYAKKKNIDLDDVKLAMKIITQKTYITVPPREMLMDLAKIKNTTPLPLIRSASGLRLPPDRFCLTQPNYKLQFSKKTPMLNPTTPLRLGQGSTTSVFKTPSSYPIRLSGEPEAKKQKRDF